jgi:hypothetical protein
VPLSLTPTSKVILLAAILVGILLISVTIIFNLEPPEEKTTNEDTVQQKIDDRVSPLTNQALILEIQRIRHRGLLEKMMSYGLSWNKKPTFYYTATIDGLEISSKEAYASGGIQESVFQGWDTMFQETRITKDIQEEQSTSEITLAILEQVPTGLLGLRTSNVERESIQLTYDYRTGHWTGDDYLEDDDGYGHYLGDTFEVWFNIYQTEFDGDGIPYWAEVNILHTDPQEPDAFDDPDGDGIPTYWEWKWGYNPFVWDDHENLDPDLDGIENIEEYQMEKYFADPFHQDMYIEVDGMERGGLFDPPHVCWEESQQIMIERFAQHNINVYIDYGWPDGPVNGGGELLPHYDVLSYSPGSLLQFYTHHFADERKGIFRYMVICHAAGFCFPSKYFRCDTIAIGTNLQRMMDPFGAKRAFTPRTWRCALAALMMHEMGHSLGMFSWNYEGIDNLTYADSLASWKQYDNTWGQYESVMNYFHTYDYNTLMDYSDGSNGPPYDRNDWLHISMANFQIESTVIADVTYESPGKKFIINETIEFMYPGWEYSENLTSQFLEENVENSPVEPIEVEWRVYHYVGNETLTSGRTLRMYARPLVEPTYSQWSLIYEGYYDAENTIQLGVQTFNN